MEKKELVALLCLSTWCLVIGVWFFLTIPRVCLHFVIVVFPDHTHLVFITAWPNRRCTCSYNGRGYMYMYMLLVLTMYMERSAVAQW